MKKKDIGLLLGMGMMGKFRSMGHGKQKPGGKIGQMLFPLALSHLINKRKEKK